MIRKVAGIAVTLLLCAVAGTAAYHFTPGPHRPVVVVHVRVVAV